MSELGAKTWLNDRYRLDSCLAQGPASATWQVWDQYTGQACILKQLSLGRIEQWKRLELFRREARILANLDHPQIPALLDYFEEILAAEASVYLITEKVPGVPLASKISEGQGLPEDFCYLVAVQVLQILHYLHTRMPPVVHRDIKPSNLLLDENGCVYLIDFGGVQEVLPLQAGGGSTIIGTYGYMAPEQYGGRAVPQTDLYGLGATLIHLLTGLRPDQLPNPDMLIDFHPFVSCSERFANWVEQLILPSLEQRFYSAKEALEVLQDILPVYTRILPVPAPVQRQQAAKPDNSKSLDQVQIPLREDVQEAQSLEQNWTLALGYLLQARWKIERVLAQGEIVVTYQAQDLENSQAVVVKELHFYRIEHWKSYELFEREVKIMQCMCHPRIPRLLASFQQSIDGRHCYYLVTTFLPGMSLLQRMRSGWCPSEATVRRLADHILEILIYLHEEEPQIIHRDIKPSNILVDDKNRPYLIDFGAVQEMFREQGSGGSTVIGTYGYMAPEQFLGQAVPASDLYGLGVSLLHLMTGRSPAEMLSKKGLGLDFQGILKASPGLSWWLGKMIAPELSQRFATAREARKALADVDLLRVEQAEIQPLPFQSDPAIVIEDLPEKLLLKLMPTYHDHKALLQVLLGLNIVGALLLSAVPGLGPLLILALLTVSSGVVLYQRSEGMKIHMHIEVSLQGLRLQAWKQGEQGCQEILENMDLPLLHIEGLSLDHTMVHNRLQVRLRSSPTAAPMLCKSRLPIAHHTPRAQYLIQRLQKAVDTYQRKRKHHLDSLQSE